MLTIRKRELDRERSFQPGGTGNKGLTHATKKTQRIYQPVAAADSNTYKTVFVLQSYLYPRALRASFRSEGEMFVRFMFRTKQAAPHIVTSCLYPVYTVTKQMTYRGSSRGATTPCAAF